MPRTRNKEHIAVENKLDRPTKLRKDGELDRRYANSDSEKCGRNDALVRDYLNDMSIVDMIAKYKITWQRICKIKDTYRWVGANNDKE